MPLHNSNGLPEVLSPAGDLERLKMAVLYGADAVYLGGGGFSMRAAAKGFPGGELIEAVKLCHSQGVLAYLTLNTVPHPPDLALLPELLSLAREAMVDAIIVSDIGVLTLIKQTLPDMPVHISTQAGVLNELAATAFFNLGASRVILARECSLDEIKAIRQNTPPELQIEAFVHGAMCMSFSGRCVLSDYLTGRDANRGECAQPCRWKWHLSEEKRPGEFFPIYEEEGGSYILNARDLCLIDHLYELWKAGVTSFKIEGRTKSAIYTAIATGAYRAAVDSLNGADSSWQPPEWCRRELLTLSHRRYSKGFLFGRPSGGQQTDNGGYIRDYEMSGIVLGEADGFLRISQRLKFSVGDELEMLPPRQMPFKITVTDMFDNEMSPISTAPHPMMEVLLPLTGELAYRGGIPEGSIVRKRANTPVNEG